MSSLVNCLIILLVSRVSYAILNGDESNKSKLQNETSPQTNNHDIPLDSNTTFYYEANEFVNKNINNRVEHKSKVNEKKSVPASLGTSARNGRMMDLDALVGDFAASQANKERNFSGNRQSRFLTSSNLNIGDGKKLHIQGFIPIVGVKDITEDSDHDVEDQSEQAQRQKQRAASQHSNDLPYAQSSVGHATFGVQRYLNSDQQPFTGYSNQQAEHKVSGSSVMETLKKPIKKLTGFGGTSVENQQNHNSNQQQNCLCVPFYMCKNGYISESSLGRSQIQQMISQQQLSNNQIEMKSGHLLPATQAPRAVNAQQDQHFFEPNPLIDERSLDREIVTISPLITNSYSNQTDVTSFDISLSADNQTNFSPSSENSQQLNSTDSNEYSQDILGRMLGLKSSQASSTSSQTGVCGLLRTCCNIPLHLYPTQQDLANERFMSQLNGQSKNFQQAASNEKQTVYNSGSESNVGLIEAPQQQLSMQSFQQSLIQKMPFGYPAQPLNSFNNPGSVESALLAHRTSPLQANLMKNQQQFSVAQYKRAPLAVQQLQSFQANQQQPFQQAKAMSVNNVQSSYHQKPLNQIPPVKLLAQSGLGTRKILDGRCGLRQAAGITGRVQNLQYHESSADFGEYPAQAAILKRLSGSDSLFVCGGTLISQYWIATAAHCIKKHNQKELKVRLGEWDVHRDDEFYPFVEKEVRDLIIHPEFVAGNLVNDIALLRLDSPIDPSLPHVNPACLPTMDETFTRQNCWVTGWGKDSFGQKGSFQAVLREVELPVVGQGECEAALKQTRLGPHYRLHSGFICAGGEGGRDACEGDGGSGLYCIHDGVIKVAGLVSWGIGCGQAGVPGVYVNLAHYRPWIENIISIDEDLYSPYTNMIGSTLISERSNGNNSGSDSANQTITTTTTSQLEE